MGSIERIFDELDSPSSYAELKTIISQVNLENRASEILFKGKYQVLLLENLLPWQKPIGQFFQTVLAICGVKYRKFSSAVDDIQYESHLSDEDEDGCPLPVVFDSLLSPNSGSSSVAVIKHLKEKFYLYPLSQAVGRKLLMLCNFIADEYKFPYPIIAMCHGSNPKSIAILGTFKDEKLVQVVVNSHGSVSKHEQLPKLSSVKLSHLAGFVPSCTAVETSVYARYDMLVGCDSSSELQPCKNMNVVLECEWSNPDAILASVSTDCSCYAKIKAISGDDNSGASERYKEIKLIKALRDSLDTGVIEWPNLDTYENLMQRIEEFINVETAVLLKHRAKPPAADSDFAESFDTLVQGVHNNYDFTDKLWLVLKNCSSCEALKDALTYVFQELNELMDPPFVHAKNVSTIALNIKNMREKAVHWPSLTSHLASQYLLEIGIEKLKRDYVTVFVGLELAPYDSINYFLQPEITSHEAVTCLEKLHCALELTIIGLKCLHLSKLLLSELIRNVLKYYSTVPNIDLQHVFKFKIPATKATYLLDKMRPTIWEISLLSSDKDFKKQTVLHYSTTPTVSHIYAPENYHPNLMLKNASYAYMTGTLIEDSFFVK